MILGAIKALARVGRAQGLQGLCLGDAKGSSSLSSSFLPSALVNFPSLPFFAPKKIFCRKEIPSCSDRLALRFLISLPSQIHNLLQRQVNNLSVCVNDGIREPPSP